MCKAITDGGQRCAAHTRPAYEAAAPNTPVWDRAAADYASTPTGAAVLTSDWQAAQRLSALHPTLVNIAAEMALRQALTRGDQIREANQCTAATLTQSVADEPVVDDEAGEWDYGTPDTTVGEHWSIAEGGDRWHAGGCGAFAIALTERWPHLKIAAEMYHDHGAESVTHAWAYDPATSTRFHIFGAETWEPTVRPDYDPDSHRVLLDQSAEDVRRLFRGFNTSEDAVYDALEVVCEQFDPAYAEDPDAGDRNHLYFW